MRVRALAACVLFLVRTSDAGGGYPPKVEGVTLINSRTHENVSLSFKEPNICETAPGVKSYSGYVHLPPRFLADQDYPINTFFWFFESRNDPQNAPLVIWLNGGAGASSMTGLLEEIGPCTIASDSATTILNPFSWNNNANLIFIDQPNQVGFSYDVPTNGTQVPRQDGFGFDVVLGDPYPDVKNNLTIHRGTFSTQKTSATANSTTAAADAFWHFLQIWLSDFPHSPSSNVRISLWTESYGGHYGPQFARFIHEQNKKINNHTSPLKDARHINLDTLGIISGMFNVALQMETGIHYAFNNSYDLTFINQTTHSNLLNLWSRPGGCHDLLLTCQCVLSTFPPSSPNHTHNICNQASSSCTALATTLHTSSTRGFYDLTHPPADPFPPPHLHGYLRRSSVLRALGVPVNYSSISPAVADAFVSTFDWLHPGNLDDLAHLLDHEDVAVHLLYGDRDPSADWVGGEKASLSIPWGGQKKFRQAGYTPLHTSSGAVKGMTRQLGKLSFTRVFQAGHEVPAYQPEAALAVLERAMGGRDVATGRVEVGKGYKTEGERDVWAVKMKAGKMPRERCYILKPMSCRREVWDRVVRGKVEVVDWFVVDGDEEEVGDL
ncbi:carboxypeptidase C [Podospora aff. communis PSN243]|uniref:Carboxypeptidase C n=1 Tax=Podospora aff. communis PSN243 TaxID=3040156 RepID=A0AAV9G9U0_9PEZI|nr:carboxypeptidase C [Podospora aff. communis PSN243]